jgi:Ubiquitinol-cytochrome C reductase Fe-S subunit TAT signal
MKHDKTDPESRREFLKAGAAMGAVVGAGATAAALIPGAVAAAPEGPAQAQPEHKGYQATQHVLEYYRTARI